MNTRICLSYDKSALMRAIAKKRSLKGILRDFDGTWIDALKMLQDDPRDAIPIVDCDNADERGHCKGHPEQEAERHG
jgi:hypothetical protein